MATAVDNKEQKDTTPSADEQLETITPSEETRIIVLRDGEIEHKFEQKPLSFFGKLEFFSLMGRTLDKAMQGDEGLSLSQLFEVPQRSGDGSLRPNDYLEADMFVRGISKLAEQAPELMGELFCIALSVPRGSREYVTNMMEQPAEEGGLSDDDGFGILETFIAQNWGVLNSFFRDRIPALLGQVREKTEGDKKTSKKPGRARAGTRSSKQ